MLRQSRQADSSIDFPISQTRRLIQKLEHTEELPRAPERKDRLQSVLEDQAEALYQRKLKSQERKRRVEEMADQLETKRNKMLSKIEEREKRTDGVLSKNQRIRNDRLKGRNEKFEKVLNYNFQQQSKLLDENLEKRKEFYSTHTASQTPGHASVSYKTTPKASGSRALGSGDLLQSQIEQKLRKAEQKHNQQKRITIQKMKNHQKKVEQARERVQSNEKDSAVLEKMGSYISKIENARNQAKSAKSHNPNRQKEMLERTEKLKKNISRMEEERQERIRELNEKFERQYGFKRTAANKTVDYKDMQQKNLMRLELEKEAKNDQILKKHMDFALQNKAYKKCRSKLFDMMSTNAEAL